MIFYLILFMITTNFAVARNNTNKSVVRSAEFEKTMTQILKKSPKNLTGYIIIGRNRCNFCLDEILEIFGKSPKSKNVNVGVILLGDDAEYMRIQNIIHRGKVQFIAVNGIDYDTLVTLDSQYTASLRLLVRKLANNKYYFQDAPNDKPESIVQFLTSKN